MTDEDGFLAAIRHTPADDVTRLVFADWLDEHDDPTCQVKAQFIRREQRTLDERKNRFAALWNLRLLAARLDPLWLAVVSRPPLHGCRERHQFDCQSRWHQLAPTDDPRVRRCESCHRDAHYCDTLTEALNHAARGTRFALTLAESLECGTSRPQPASAARVPLPLVPPPQSAEWVPEPQVWGPGVRPPQSPRREKGRGRNRNLQREDWEDER